MICKNCGTPVNGSVRFCGKCGTPVPAEAGKPSLGTELKQSMLPLILSVAHVIFTIIVTAVTNAAFDGLNKVGATATAYETVSMLNAVAAGFLWGLFLGGFAYVGIKRSPMVAAIYAVPFLLYRVFFGFFSVITLSISWRTILDWFENVLFIAVLFGLLLLARYLLEKKNFTTKTLIGGGVVLGAQLVYDLLNLAEDLLFNLRYLECYTVKTWFSMLSSLFIGFFLTALGCGLVLFLLEFLDKKREGC